MWKKESHAVQRVTRQQEEDALSASVAHAIARHNGEFNGKHYDVITITPRCSYNGFAKDFPGITVILWKRRPDRWHDFVAEVSLANYLKSVE